MQYTFIEKPKGEYGMKREVLKRLAALLLIAAAALTCTGCFEVPYGDSFAVRGERDNVESIEIYHVTAMDWEGSKIADRLEPIAVIPSEKFDEFLDKLNGIPSFRKRHLIVLLPLGAIDPSFSLYGYAVRIRYTDGEAEYISNHAPQFFFDADGEEQLSRYSCSNSVWIEFLSEYADIEAEEAAGAAGTANEPAASPVWKPGARWKRPE